MFNRFKQHVVVDVLGEYLCMCIPLKVVSISALSAQASISKPQVEAYASVPPCKSIVIV